VTPDPSPLTVRPRGSESTSPGSVLLSRETPRRAPETRTSSPPDLTFRSPPSTVVPLGSEHLSPDPELSSRETFRRPPSLQRTVSTLSVTVTSSQRDVSAAFANVSRGRRRGSDDSREESLSCADGSRFRSLLEGDPVIRQSDDRPLSRDLFHVSRTFPMDTATRALVSRGARIANRPSASQRGEVSALSRPIASLTTRPAHTGGRLPFTVSTSSRNRRNCFTVQELQWPTLQVRRTVCL
jgi:hypothetical protein